MSDLTDAQVLAELRKDELRVWHAPVTTVGGRHLQTVFRNTFTRLALSRIEAREAAAREREEVAEMLEREAFWLDGAEQPAHDNRSRTRICALAARIRARGGAAARAERDRLAAELATARRDARRWAAERLRDWLEHKGFDVDAPFAELLNLADDIERGPAKEGK